MESLSNPTTSYVLLCIIRMGTSNFEYEYMFHDIKISMNAYWSRRGLVGSVLAY